MDRLTARKNLERDGRGEILGGESVVAEGFIEPKDSRTSCFGEKFQSLSVLILMYLHSYR